MLKLSFSGQNHIRSLTNSHRHCQWEGGQFSFLVQKSALKVLKTGYFAYTSGQWRGFRLPAPPGYATVNYQNLISSQKCLKWALSKQSTE